MKTQRNSGLKKYSLLSAVLAACVSANFSGTKASAASLVNVSPINFNLVVNNQNFGGITIEEVSPENNPNLEGLGGRFFISEDISELQTRTDWVTLLRDTGVKSLNWFQVITDTNFRFRTHNHGNAEGLLSTPFIDLPNGGHLYTWADAVPWYWHEQAVPPNYFNVENAGRELGIYLDPVLVELGFRDIPNLPPGAFLEFETFLIADFGNKKYDVLDGFSWKWESKTHDEFEDNPEGNNLPGIWDRSDEQDPELGHDTNGNGVWDPGEPFWDRDGEGEYEEGDEYFDNGNGQYDKGEAFVNTDGDEPFDPGDPFTDLNGNGVFDRFTDVTFLQAGAQFTYEALIAS